MNNSEYAAREYQCIINLIKSINRRYSLSYYGIRCFGSGARYLIKLTNCFKNCARQKEVLELLNGHAENPYMYQIYSVTDSNLYFRVASTAEYHKHKRGQYYHYVTVPLSQLKYIFENEIIELKRQKLTRLEARKKTLNHELYQINKEIEELKFYLDLD